MDFLTVNRKLLPIKLHYGLFNAGTGAIFPSMPVYAKVLGFSSFVVGTIYTILPLLSLIIKPAFGAIADKFKCHRGVLIVCEILVCVLYFGIWFIPPAPRNQTTEILFLSANGSSAVCPNIAVDSKCNSSCSLEPQFCLNKSDDFCSTLLPFTSSYINSTDKNELGIARPSGGNFSVIFESGCRAACNVSCEDGVEKVDSTFSKWQFWLFLVLLVGTFGGTSVIITLSDTLCIEICEDPHLYGRQRLWGSLGWGACSVINGLLIDAVSIEGQEKNYSPAFYLMLVPLILDFFVSYKLKVTIPAQSKNIGRDVWKVMLVPRNIVFMIWCVMVGISFGVVWNFLFWLLEDLAEKQGPSIVASIKTIEGLVIGFQCALGEIPSFFFGGWIVKKLGHFRSMTLIFTAIGLRCTLYSQLANPWWCLPIEVLQSNFGIFYSTMTSYAKKIGPPGTEATIQSVLSVICDGIGLAVGSFIGGVLYDSYGGSIMMLVFGITFFVMAVLNECTIFLFKILDGRHEEKGVTELQINTTVDPSDLDQSTTSTI